MANQFALLCEEAVRGTRPDIPVWLPIPITGKLQPAYNPKDEPRKAFMGADTALGDTEVQRKETQWTHTLETPWFPIASIGLLLKHTFGKSVARSVLETIAYKGILYPLNMCYGEGAELGTKAIGYCCNTDEGGTTKSQYYGGGRVKSCSISISGSDDVKLTFELQGAGKWVGTPDEAAIATPDFSIMPAAFNSADSKFYIGAGITRTGVAPNYTDLVPNTMTPFLADKMEIKITNGLDDKIVGDGAKGPSKTYRASQFSVDVDTTVDYEDPSSGFSSADEFKKIFSGPVYNSLLIVLDNGVLAGDTTETYRATIDLPYMQQKFETPDRNPEGKTPSMSGKFKSLYPATTKYPAAIFTVDQIEAY